MLIEPNTTRLPELPTQPAKTQWPTENWSRGELPDNPELARHADAVFDLPEAAGVSYALLIVQHGRLVYERYAAGANAFYLQYSWSMAKSITQALVGILVRQGRLDLTCPGAGGRVASRRSTSYHARSAAAHVQRTRVQRRLC